MQNRRAENDAAAPAGVDTSRSANCFRASVTAADPLGCGSRARACAGLSQRRRRSRQREGNCDDFTSSRLSGHLRAIAREFTARGIRVNARAPGAIDTPSRAKFSTAQWLGQVVEITPMGRIGSAREVAEVIGFLCSDASTYLTGTVIRIDGGMVA